MVCSYMHSHHKSLKIIVMRSGIHYDVLAKNIYLDFPIICRIAGFYREELIIA